MMCNGCGNEIDDLGGAFLYGGPSKVPDIHDRIVLGDVGMYTADHARTLCPKCTVVMKDMLLQNNLSDHWHKYDFDDD